MYIEIVKVVEPNKGACDRYTGVKRVVVARGKLCLHLNTGETAVYTGTEWTGDIYAEDRL